jgi:ketosteroid isomerase-like protein
MAMSDRAQMEKTLREAYAARKRGDLDTLGRIFAPHARFQMAGSNASPIASKVVGAAEYRPLLAGMIRTFEILDYTIVSMLIDGSAAAVQWHAKMRSSITGQTVETDLFDLIEIEDGQIASFLEFCDTALAARMMQQ